MGPVTNDVLLTAILDLKGDVGTLIGKVESQRTNLAAHIDDDAAMAADISTLKTQAAERRGVSRVMHAVSGGLGSLIGVAATLLTRHHG